MDYAAKKKIEKFFSLSSQRLCVSAVKFQLFSVAFRRFSDYFGLFRIISARFGSFGIVWDSLG